MDKEKRLILVGVISSAHGIKGDIIVKSYTQDSKDICKYNLFDENGNQIKLKFLKLRSPSTLICKLDGSNTRNDAENCIGVNLYSTRDNFPKLKENEFYISDLEGKGVVNEEGDIIGVINCFVNYGAGDIVEIKFKGGSVEFVPFTDEFFPNISSDKVEFKEKLYRKMLTK